MDFENNYRVGLSRKRMTTRTRGAKRKEKDKKVEDVEIINDDR